MSGLALSGVFTGIDGSALVEAIMAVNNLPLGRLEDQKSQWEAKKAVVDDLQRRLTTMESVAEGVSDSSTINTTVASSTDTDIVGANSDIGAIAGSHTVEINQLATSEHEVNDGLTPTERWRHTTGVATADTEYISAANITTGSDDTFKFKFGTESQITVDLSAYDATGITLNQLVSAINTEAGYTAASAVQDGSEYKLEIVAQAAGNGRGLTITESNSIDMLDSTDDFDQIVDSDTAGDALVGAGVFAYTYNSVTRTITLTSDDSLSSMVAKINNDAANPGVAASILEYQGASGGRYHLVLNGEDSGSDYGITIEAATTLSGFEAADWTQTQAAQDSQFRIDGYPSGAWINRSGNQVTDAIPGVTLNLRDTGTVTVNIERNSALLLQDVRNIVDTYTSLANRVKADTGYDEDTETSGVFQGDSTLLRLLSRLREHLVSTTSGFVADDDTYSHPVDIGIEIDKDGQVTLDEDTFNDALDTDFDAVLALVGAAKTGVVADATYFEFQAADLTLTDAGVYEVKADFDGAGNITAGWMRLEGEGTWRAANVSDNVLTGKFANPEEQMHIKVIWDGASSSQQTEVKLQEGFGGAIYREIQDITDYDVGMLSIKENSIDAAIDQVEDRIEQTERRLARVREALDLKFSRLEATMAALDAQRSAYEAMFQVLDAQRNSDNN